MPGRAKGGRRGHCTDGPVGRAACKASGGAKKAKPEATAAVQGYQPYYRAGRDSVASQLADGSLGARA